LSPLRKLSLSGGLTNTGKGSDMNLIGMNTSYTTYSPI